MLCVSPSACRANMSADCQLYGSKHQHTHVCLLVAPCQQFLMTMPPGTAINAKHHSCRQIALQPVSQYVCMCRSMLIAGVAFLIGCVWQVAAKKYVGLLLVGRIFWGVGVGFADQSVTIYNAEMAPPQWRGLLHILFQTATVTGKTASCIQHDAFSTLHSARCIQHTAFRRCIQHAAFSIHLFCRSTCNNKQC